MKTVIHLTLRLFQRSGQASTSVPEEYFCGLCGKMMPLSHFPH